VVGGIRNSYLLQEFWFAISSRLMQMKIATRPDINSSETMQNISFKMLILDPFSVFAA
jgi:hypothetical protein